MVIISLIKVNKTVETDGYQRSNEQNQSKGKEMETLKEYKRWWGGFADTMKAALWTYVPCSTLVFFCSFFFFFDKFLIINADVILCLFVLHFSRPRPHDFESLVVKPLQEYDSPPPYSQKYCARDQ